MNYLNFAKVGVFLFLELARANSCIPFCFEDVFIMSEKCINMIFLNMKIYDGDVREMVMMLVLVDGEGR